jgi:UDP-glucuronate 4-epimerase
MRILITGSCGFIGSHLTERLLKEDNIILGIDNLNNIIYDSYHKLNNKKTLDKFKDYTHITNDIINVTKEITEFNPEVVIHLAAYANVRKSQEIPNLFIKNNVETTCSLINCLIKLDKIPLFIYASSSSVYGSNKKIPFSENDELNNIISPYALSKKMCEDLVNFYCNNSNLKAVCLRFFTVYGPRCRPDMAIHNFLKNIINGKEITLYGDGSTERDYTYIDDIISGITSCIKYNIKDNEHLILNLGNNYPIKLLDLINLCEKITEKPAKIINKEIPNCDTLITYADICKAKKIIDYTPKYSIEKGLTNTYLWIKEYYKLDNTIEDLQI